MKSIHVFTYTRVHVFMRPTCSSQYLLVDKRLLCLISPNRSNLPAARVYGATVEDVVSISRSSVSILLPLNLIGM